MESLFNIRLARKQTQSGASLAADDGGGSKSGSSVGAFVTPQTLVTFPGATGVITTLWAAIDAFKLVPTDSKPLHLLVGAVLSILVGTAIYLLSDTPPDGKARIVGAVVAVINTAILFNAARAIMGA